MSDPNAHNVTNNGHSHALPADSHTNKAAPTLHTHTEPAAAGSSPTALPTPTAANDPNTHTLDTPIVRGSQTITAITLRKPKSGELRGVSLSDLVNLDVAALSKVLPRISSPTLTEQDVANMDPADLVMLGGVFAGFLMPKAVRSKLESQTA